MKNNARFASGRRFDIVCLGRLAVDFYAQQIGARLEDVASFAKYLGGSSANTAFGCARLGLKAAMAARVGDDAMGRFLAETLAREGCDVSHVSVDPARLTAAVVLGIKDRDTFPLIFYRENCADMAVTEDDVAEDFLAQSRALLITGTHFSTPHVHRVSTTALARARRNGVRTVLDIDYRPVLWGLTKRGDGATRFIASDAVTAHLQAILPLFDLVIGTEEEFSIAGGATDIIAALSAVRAVTPATLVVKRGPMGCAVIDDAIPRSLDDAFNGRGVTVEVLNVLGAGDAFSAGFLSGWVRGESYDDCCRYANACGALVVSRHGCAPAMPTRVELDHYLANAGRIPRPDRDIELTRLHRKTAPRTPRPELFIFAFDHRDPFVELARATGANEGRLPALKGLFVEAVAQTEAARGLAGRVGLLCDDRYGQAALNAATGRGWWVGRPVEWPGSNPLVFEHGRSIGTTLLAWPVEQVVKCLVPFHPDDDVDNRLENEAQVRALHDAVQTSGHELLIEIVPPKHLPAGPDVLVRALKRLYNLGIYPEWWKLPPPAAAQWPAIDALIAERDPYCRGVVLLGLAAPIEALARGFADAAGSRSCRGFAVGRTIFHDPARAWLAGAIGDAELVAGVRRNFEALIDLWMETRSQPGPFAGPVRLTPMATPAAPAALRATAAAPLAGITVVDLTNVLAGPFAAYQLACLGARVIKVESPDGDLARRLGADPVFARAKMGISFLAVNAGKESIALDLKHADGKAVLLRFADRADCLIENFRPGVMTRLGLDHRALEARNPRLVYCAISGFGQTGPFANRPAYDQIIQGLSGAMSVTGDAQSAPLRVGYPVCDTIGGLTAAFAVCASLLRARATGEGAFIDVSMLDSTLATMGWVVSNYLNAGIAPQPMGNDNFTAAPSGTFRTGDGLLNIAANEQKQFEALADLVGAPQLKTDPRFAEREARKRHRAALTGALEAQLTAHTAAEWEERMVAAGVPAGRVLSVPEILEHAHTGAAAFVAEYAGVAGLDNPVRVARPGFRVDGERPEAVAPPPALSAQRDALLTELGYADGERAALVQSGAVR